MSQSNTTDVADTQPDESETKQPRQPMYRPGPNDIPAAKQALQTCVVFEKWPKGHKKIVLGLLDLLEEKEGVIDASHVVDKTKLKPNTVKIYTEALVKAGLFTKYVVNRGKPGRRNLYELVDIETYVAIADQQAEESASLVKPRDMEQLELDGYDREGDILSRSIMTRLPEYHRAEIFSTYTLLSVLRLGTTGERAQGSFTTPVYVADSMMRIKVSAPEGQKLAGIMDSKALIAISTLARQYYSTKKKEQYSEPMVIDMGDFVRYMGYTDDGGNRRQVWDMLRAWRHTNYEVLSATESLTKLFGNELFEIDEFAFISRLKTLISGNQRAGDRIDSEHYLPLRFAIWLDPLYLNRLMDPSYRYLSAVHQKIMQERNPSRLLLYYWCRRAIQHKTVCRSPWTIEKLQREIAPYMSRHRFTKLLRKALGEPDEKTGNYCVYGYRIYADEYDRDMREISYKIWADRTDPLVKGYNAHIPIEQ